MTLRAVAFGDLATGIWGVALSPHPELPSIAIVGPEPRVAVGAELSGGASGGEEWFIAGDGLDLAVSPEAAAAGEPQRADTTGDSLAPAGADDARGAEGDLDQLVTVRGALTGEHPREVDLLGCRSARVDAIEPGRSQLLRYVCGWLPRGEGFALVAIRPRRAAGHGDERVTATVFSGGESQPVAESRLSTTYAEAGRPVRATLELWPAEEEDRDQRGEEQPAKYPRRAAGEATGAGTLTELGPFELRVQPFRWRSEGREGAGMYLLARAR